MDGDDGNEGEDMIEDGISEDDASDQIEVPAQDENIDEDEVLEFGLEMTKANLDAMEEDDLIVAHKTTRINSIQIQKR